MKMKYGVKEMWLWIWEFLKKRHFTDWIIFITFIILIGLCIVLFYKLDVFKVDGFSKLFSTECSPKILGQSVGNSSQSVDDKSKTNCNLGVFIERLGFAIGGVIALLVALASFQRAKALDDTAKAQEQGNIEDRYKNAITQFGNANSSVRLAGAYGLYHLAIDNEKRRKNICDVLCVHIRDLTTSKELIFNNKSYSDTYKAKPSNEVQSILDLLTNKDDKNKFPFKGHWINLANAYLNGANLYKAQLQGADLEGVQLEGADLKETNLNNARLQGGNFKNAKNLTNTQIRKAKDSNLENVCLAGLNLSGGNLSNFNLSNAQLQGTKLEKADLRGADLREAQLQYTNLKKAQLQGADLERAQSEGADLREAQLQWTNLDEAQFEGANLNYTNLQRANLIRAQFLGAALRGAQLQGANLSSAYLQGANLSSAQLQGTNLSFAYLQGANLSSTELQGADLSSAELQGANLWDAKLQGASLSKTDFRGAFTNRPLGFYLGPKILIDDLKARINKKDDIKNAIFSGGVTEEELKNFKQRAAEMLKKPAKIKDYIHYIHFGGSTDSFVNFKNKMNRVEKVLEENKDKPEDASIPSEAITGIYPEVEAKKIIEMLEEVKKGLDEIREKIDAEK